jgi:hypothetical protein
MADLNKVELAEICRELLLPIPFSTMAGGVPVQGSPIMSRSISTYLQKADLIKDKQNALVNLMGTIDSFAASNTALIAEASMVSAKAIGMRVNLEISVLESQLKMLEIESLTIDTMTANAFIDKYGA